MQLPTTSTLLAIMATLSPIVVAHPYPNPSNDAAIGRDVPPGVTVARFNLRILDPKDQKFTLYVPTDGRKHNAPSLLLIDAAHTPVTSKIEVAKIDPDWYDDSFCCQIDFNKCYQLGDIIGGGHTIDPAQSMDLVRCQELTGGICGAWPATKLHNAC